ncbi:hypothetical protein KUH03_05030 [Sphingobacterium sp. E70]|uniref:hypothetical protein n=1 Tax=Sphingobacterium sp. E70 TaxID=2853439 RepID=UPI00211C788C|nr:hypothetical protein [Sphingobacterium sp. E70]ULT26282.1 hypothetical protein KUH03_05030 [Sphingobacterium sp. E70]
METSKSLSWRMRYWSVPKHFNNQHEKIFISALLSLSMIGIVVGQKQDFKLTLNRQSPSSEAKVFVRYFVGQKLKIDSVSLNSSHVAYKGQIDEPTQVILFYSKDGTSFFP